MGVWGFVKNQLRKMKEKEEQDRMRREYNKQLRNEAFQREIGRQQAIQAIERDQTEKRAFVEDILATQRGFQEAERRSDIGPTGYPKKINRPNFGFDIGNAGLPNSSRPSNVSNAKRKKRFMQEMGFG